MDLERKKISKNASEAAAYWVLRLESRECKPADRLAFEIWRNADPLNSAAYLCAQKGLASVDGQLGSPELSELSEQILIETRGNQKRGNWYRCRIVLTFSCWHLSLLILA